VKKSVVHKTMLTLNGTVEMNKISIMYQISTRPSLGLVFLHCSVGENVKLKLHIRVSSSIYAWTVKPQCF